MYFIFDTLRDDFRNALREHDALVYPICTPLSVLGASFVEIISEFERERA